MTVRIVEIDAIFTLFAEQKKIPLVSMDIILIFVLSKNKHRIYFHEHGYPCIFGFSFLNFYQLFLPI